MWRGGDVLWMVHGPKKICKVLLAITIQMNGMTPINHVLSFRLRYSEQVCKNLGMSSEYGLVNTKDSTLDGEHDRAIVQLEFFVPCKAHGHRQCRHHRAY